MPGRRYKSITQRWKGDINSMFNWSHCTNGSFCLLEEQKNLYGSTYATRGKTVKLWSKNVNVQSVNESVKVVKYFCQNCEIYLSRQAAPDFPGIAPSHSTKPPHTPTSITLRLALLSWQPTNPFRPAIISITGARKYCLVFETPSSENFLLLWESVKQSDQKCICFAAHEGKVQITYASFDDPRLGGSACIIGSALPPWPTAWICTTETFANFHFLQQANSLLIFASTETKSERVLQLHLAVLPIEL